MSQPSITDVVARYYTDKVREHGAEPRGVDWNSAESQRLRFEQLLRVVDRTKPFSLTDYGCGYGALLEELTSDKGLVCYQGFDIAPAMIEQAQRRHDGRSTGAAATRRFTSDPGSLQPTDYVVASGIFNVKVDVEAEAWRRHILATIEDMARLAKVGFAFNALTSHSDLDRRRDHLYYADPAWFFDHVKRHLANQVSLIHDYPLWEFTILARK